MRLQEEDMHSQLWRRHAAWQEVRVRRMKPTRRLQVEKSKEKSCSQPLKVAREFFQETSLSGMKFITREDGTILDRMVWIGACLISLVAALFFIRSAWDDYLESPILTTIQDAYYPLHKLSFPAITVCPSNNIRTQVGEQLLLQFLNVSHDGTKSLQHLMDALSSLRYPYYRKMEQHLKNVKDIHRFDGLNITDFMLQVLPELTDLMDECYWQGRKKNCSSLFNLQRYEGGFCYSFNSLTSENKTNCSLIYTDKETPLTTPGKEYQSHGCGLLNNAASGTTTGLEVYLQPTKSADVPGEARKRTTTSEGIRVLWHAPNEYPLAGSGLFMLDKQSKVGTIKIKTSITESSSSLRSLSPDQRNCWYEDEMTLQFYPTYSQANCFIECRMRFIEQVCKCLPYFFSRPYDSTPACSVSQLKCIIEQSKRFGVVAVAQIPQVFVLTGANHVLQSWLRSIANYTRNLKFSLIPGGQVTSNKMNCSDCLPTCNRVRYDVDASFSEDIKPFAGTNRGYLNVYYKEESAIKYLRAPAVDEMKLLVSFGGIAGLFLGVSLITGFEVLYYLVRFCKACCYHCCRLIASQRSIDNGTSRLDDTSAGRNTIDIMQYIPHGSLTKY